MILVILLMIFPVKYLYDNFILSNDKLKETEFSKNESVALEGSSKVTKKLRLTDIEKILTDKMSIKEYEIQYGVSLVYDRDIDMYKAQQCSICGIKGIVYWKIDNEILNEASINFESCNEKLSYNQSKIIINYLNSKIGNSVEARLLHGGWFYRIWLGKNMRYYLGEGSYSDFGGSHKIMFTITEYNEPITDGETGDTVITLMQNFSNETTINDVEEKMGVPTEKNEGKFIYKKYTGKFNELIGDVIVFYDYETSYITSIWWKYETEEYLKTYEDCICYLKEKFGDYYVSPKNPEKKIWNDFAVFYSHDKTSIILKRTFK